MSSSNNKVKILLVGTIGNQVEDFVTKLTSLQKSKAGPFDACFCVGPVSSSLLNRDLPLPVYLQDASQLTLTGEEQEGVVELGPNLYAFIGAQVTSIDIKQTQLVVASCPPHFRWDSESSLNKNLSHVSYVGCDLLLSSEWPQGVEGLLSSGETEVGSYDVAQVALLSRPRYHVSIGESFGQSPPFAHLQATTSTFTPKHAGRFLSLGKVKSPAESKAAGKTGKFVHALGLTPLQYMTADELQTPTTSLHPNPYTDTSYPTDEATATATSTTTTVGLSEAQARRLVSESAAGGGDSHTRWAERKRPRQQQDNDNGEDPSQQEVVDPTNTTLFLHGLHKDVRGVLQTGSAVLLEAFSRYKIQRVRRPPAASSYAFLEFPSHDLAKECLETLGGQAVVAGIHLTLKWATPPKPTGEQPSLKKRRLTEADAMDSCTLYFRLPPKILTHEYQQASENLQRAMETTLEQALGDPDVTAATEPALRVKVRLHDDKNFGFLEFASHAAASMAVATLTASTDGGIVDDENKISPSTLLGVELYWAHDAPAQTDSGGLQFQRKHFPPDSRTDCWFCLASPTCEKHLIVSVHNGCYVAMPKGPVHPGHALIIPVTHSSKGALVDEDVATEMLQLTDKLRQHASQTYNMDLFVFERAIQTKGGYHTHVQCIPVERGLGLKLQATMMGMARSIPSFQLKELNTDLALGAMADNDGGYFYAEIPISSKEHKRFLYNATEEERPVVPLQFGREVLATVLDKPDMAHWKACVLDEEKETELANEFRESFSKFTEES